MPSARVTVTLLLFCVEQGLYSYAIIELSVAERDEIAKVGNDVEKARDHGLGRKVRGLHGSRSLLSNENAPTTNAAWLGNWRRCS